MVFRNHTLSPLEHYLPLSRNLAAPLRQRSADGRLLDSPMPATFFQKEKHISKSASIIGLAQPAVQRVMRRFACRTEEEPLQQPLHPNLLQTTDHGSLLSVNLGNIFYDVLHRRARSTSPLFSRFPVVLKYESEQKGGRRQMLRKSKSHFTSNIYTFFLFTSVFNL
jgi:hypothetical protein